jgi:hypothetical protein
VNVAVLTLIEIDFCGVYFTICVIGFIFTRAMADNSSKAFYTAKLNHIEWVHITTADLSVNALGRALKPFEANELLALYGF